MNAKPTMIEVNNSLGAFEETKENRQPSSPIEPKTVLYHSDGSGRDTYIMYSHKQIFKWWIPYNKF